MSHLPPKFDFSYLTHIKEKEPPPFIHRPRRNSLDDALVEVPARTYQLNRPEWENIPSEAPRTGPSQNRDTTSPYVKALFHHAKAVSILPARQQSLDAPPLSPAPSSSLRRQPAAVPKQQTIAEDSRKFVLFDESDEFAYPVRDIPTEVGSKSPPEPDSAYYNCGIGNYFLVLTKDYGMAWLSKGGSDRRWYNVTLEAAPPLHVLSPVPLMIVQDRMQAVLFSRNGDVLFVLKVDERVLSTRCWQTICLTVPGPLPSLRMALLMPNERFIYLISGDYDASRTRPTFQIDMEEQRLDVVVKRSSVEDELLSVAKGIAISKHRTYFWVHTFHSGPTQQWLPAYRLDFFTDCLHFICTMHWCYVYGKNEKSTTGFNAKISLGDPQSPYIPIRNINEVVMHNMSSSRPEAGMQCRVVAGCRIAWEPRVSLLLSTYKGMVSVDMERTTQLEEIKVEPLQKPTPNSLAAKVLQDYDLDKISHYTGWYANDFGT